MYPPEPDILAALASYREHIGSLSHRALSAMISQIRVAIPDDPDMFESEEEAEEDRLAFLLRVVGGGEDTRPPITCLSDLLTHWEALAPQLALDGAAVCCDTAWRDEMRSVYVRGVLQGLNERCGSELVATWGFPADLAVLLQHVDSLEGLGWHRHRDENERAIFLEVWVRNDGQSGPTGPTEETAAALVRTPGEIAEWTVGFEEDRPRDDGEDRSWSWRYVAALGQFGTKVFEDLVELLERWYKTHGEPREEDWDVSAEEVFAS
ncbi:hypothetical protein PG994_003893 [Apiospora phragmitis]|uniref:Uncharacterized protein n=1 Tax=Apiospora phragmitis TaxID=2905665 RepID=A0ABR1VZD3_9PEZI